MRPRFGVEMKSSPADLAIFGGDPAFSHDLHVGRPNIGDRTRLLERINDMLDRRWLSNAGPFEQELEDRIAGMVGVRNCVAMCSATIALQVLIAALGLAGEVIVPSFTFVATAHALQWQGITPVFVDVDPATHTLDPARVEEKVTRRTTGILGVHLWGQGCNVESLQAIASRHNLALLFDAAHAFGCSYQGRMIGRFGDAEVFSFHATKFFNTFEGGAVVTDDDDLAARVRLTQNFGFTGYDQVDCLGTNGKMSEVAAAMGLTGLESLDEFIEANQRNYKGYAQSLDGMAGVRLLRYAEGERQNYQYVVVEIDEGVVGVSRDQFVNVLRAENILARRYFHPGVHRMEPYVTLFPDVGKDLPVTEKLTERTMVLPTGTAVGPEQVNQIGQLIRMIAETPDEVVQRLNRLDAV